MGLFQKSAMLFPLPLLDQTGRIHGTQQTFFGGAQRNFHKRCFGTIILAQDFLKCPDQGTFRTSTVSHQHRPAQGPVDGMIDQGMPRQIHSDDRSERK